MGTGALIFVVIGFNILWFFGIVPTIIYAVIIGFLALVMSGDKKQDA